MLVFRQFTCWFDSGAVTRPTVELWRADTLRGESSRPAGMSPGDLSYVTDGSLALARMDDMESRRSDSTHPGRRRRIAMVANVPVASNRATADFLASSPLLGSDYEPSAPPHLTVAVCADTR